MLADRVLVMQGGRIVEGGPPGQVLRQPRSRFTASLAGLNLVKGIRSGNSFRASGFEVPCIGAPGLDGEEWLAAFPPSSVLVSGTDPAGPAGSTHCAGRIRAGNMLKVTVTELEPRGDRIRVNAGELAADISPAQAADLALRPGQDAYFTLDELAMAFYPAQGTPVR